MLAGNGVADALASLQFLPLFISYWEDAEIFPQVAQNSFYL
jgi:hypothetical protein